MESPSSGGTGSSLSPTPGRTATDNVARTKKTEGGVSTYDVLRYIRSAFDEAEVLDKVPLEAAGNPGAWHAWRTHRIKTGAIVPTSPSNAKDTITWHDGLSDDEGSNGSVGGAPEGYQRLAGGTSSPMAARKPGEWNWDGVWEFRVKKGIEASLSDAVLYGNAAGDDLIRFLNMEPEEIDTLKDNIRRIAETETVDRQRRGVV